jgi:hypothetical protein
MLAGGRWTRLRRGVYVETSRAAALRSDPRTAHLLDCVAVLVGLGGGAVLSHTSAARWHRFVVPRGDDGVVRLTDVVQWRTGRGYRVARAQLPADDLVPFLRFRATGPARTLVDCSREWDLTDAVVAMDAAVQARLVRRDELVAAVLAGSHRVGIGSAGRALSLADGRAESALETRARLRLLAAGLPAPELQVDVHRSGTFLARLDAWYEEAALALEFDGRVKYTDPWREPGRVLWEEKRREDDLRALGIRVVRVADADLGDRWPPVGRRLARMLGEPGPGRREFTAVPRARGLLRTG